MDQGPKLVGIYHRGQLIKIHFDQSKGGRSTDIQACTTSTPDRTKRRAGELGLDVGEFADCLFDGPFPWSSIRQGHKLLRLGERYTPQRLDAACQGALELDLIDVGRVESILVQALEHQESPEHPPPLPAGRFAHCGDVFAHGKGQLHHSTRSTDLTEGRKP
ncbi:MAG: hypothetical protein OXN21_14220 [Chloroflexota bacterium]|nr:hypothetical protein [Chloroflexota bacterium]